MYVKNIQDFALFGAADDCENAVHPKSGFPLPDGIRSELEAVFGQDFSAVRIIISVLPKQYQLEAFARDHQIYIRPGYFEPGTCSGIRLLAHELAHIVQQAQARDDRYQPGQPNRSNDLLEIEAGMAADYSVYAVFGQAGTTGSQMPKTLTIPCCIKAPFRFTRL